MISHFKQNKQNKDNTNYVPNQVLVQFKPDKDTPEMRQMLIADGAEIINEVPELDLITIKIPEEKIDLLLDKYNSNPDIEYAEHDYYYQRDAIKKFTPNDPLFKPNQYAPQRIQAQQAWAITKSRPNIMIAVVDSGVDATHPDLQGKVIEGQNYVNDGFTSIQDPDGHGTFIAGAAAAVTNNGIGIAGIGIRSKILAVRIFDASGSQSNTSIIVNAIVYSAKQGCRVINLSFSTFPPSKALRNAVKFAWNKGAVIVSSAGNFSSPDKTYPASFENVISVASTTPSDIKSQFSNFGLWVDIAAPGSSLWSTIAPNSSLLAALGYPPNTEYLVADGTSFAAPYVAGVAALLAAKSKSNTKIRNAIEKGADRIPGTGKYWRAGRINAYRALQLLNK